MDRKSLDMGCKILDIPHFGRQSLENVRPDFRDQIFDPRRNLCPHFPDSKSSLWSGKSRRLRPGLKSGTVSDLVARVAPSPPWPGKSRHIRLGREFLEIAIQISKETK